MFAFTDLRDQLALYLTQEQVEQITQAYMVAAKAHEGQKRYTGEPYISHPVEVARILAGMHMDHQCIMAAMLHDVIEDTSIDKFTIAESFGEKVAELVDGVSKLKQITFESKEQAQAENFRKMMLAMAQDIRVILIKLADRLHNMRTLGAMPAEKRRRIALETLEIYAPIAYRLGMNHMRVEFEDLGFAALYPLRYRILKESVRRARGNRKALVRNIEKDLEKRLHDVGLQDCAIWGREKHLYSLYNKMHKKRLSLSEVMDVYAFRIIVKKADECYLALGVVHGIYRPISRRFKDYIAIPKANGYQSLHTTLIGPHGVPIEVQIRTEEMEELAENGIASHWLYKTAEKETAQIHAREWLKGLLDIQKHAGNSLEFIENVKMDLFSDAVYVFTPKGNILSLPQGATPVDFAYLVHTDIGNACVGCKIDRRLAPLSTRLRNAQTVEIITAKGAHPNPAWLSFAVTGKARSNIRHWLKSQQCSESQALGKRLIDGALAASNAQLKDFKEDTLRGIIKDFGLSSVDELYEEVGLGKRMAPLVAQRILAYRPQPQTDDKIPSKKPGTLIIKGTEGLVVTYAKCCYPIPGDLIVGHLALGQGIVIHRERCPKIAKFRKMPNQCINVQWEDEVEGEFHVPVIVDVINARGVLAALANAIAECNANIINVHVDERDGRHNTVKFIISVRSRSHLARTMRRLRTVSEVTRIVRGK
ncbi:MAG: bifunctional GTP diphosphokinase/guanosine-3',5'-bis(diphosphate) 3'-diphosphatase [Gammaproteobacteria bacterium 39-13]|nr:MAG: bifunctional GTP diphosphokinase/guanosine-3',5'-bis(diphosphate) 3'-diphosphatase [Gammaproteobacteria bacterium 39-13]